MSGVPCHERLWPRRRHLWVVIALLTVGCVRTAVSLRIATEPGTPADASVTINEEFVGLLGFVAARGVRLPEGEHRITIQREGYFPWDAIVVSDRKPIHLRVKLRRIPD